MKNIVVALTIYLIGLAGGFVISDSSPNQLVWAQEFERGNADKVLIDGNARAISATSPPGEQFRLVNAKNPRSSFNVVPKGKKFVLTDVMYQTQRSVRQTIVVNIAKADTNRKTHDILFQVSLDPGNSEQVHLCSGYEIPGGYSLTAFTGGGYDPEQYVSISVTGYLVDE